MKLVLDRWQGLGDNLQVSTIPRRFYEKFGEKCVWISDAMFYRNPEIRELVWEHNPYIAGFTNEKGTDIHSYITFRYPWIEEMERIYGLVEPFSLRPEIYYKIPDEDNFNVKDKTIIDISSSNENNTMNNDRNKIKIKEYIDKIKSSIYSLKYTNLNSSIYKENKNQIIDSDNIEIKTIYDLCCVIKHCKKFIASFSGSYVLASAIRDNNIVTFIGTQHYQMNYFVFKSNIEYVLL